MINGIDCSEVNVCVIDLIEKILTRLMNGLQIKLNYIVNGVNDTCL